MKKIISCNIHDHFEIACMRKSNIVLSLHNGLVVQGQAFDLVTKNKNEFICLTTDNNENKRINLLDINTLEVEGDKAVIRVS